MNLQIRVHSHRLAVAWNGIDRLTGGIPYLENTELKYHEVVNRREDMPDSVMVFEFMHTFKDHVEIRAEISPSRGTIVFWLSPHNFHTQKSSDFVGILFDSLPGFVKGTAFYKYGPVGAWTHPNILHSMHDIAPKDNQFLLWKYEDGAYGAALPLLGKGYLASIGQHEHMIGSKAYHSMDGHNENDIPILALAFGTDPKAIIHNLYATTQGMSPDLDSLKVLEAAPPSLFQQLGWCSWNSLGRQVSHHTLIEAAKGFQAHQIPIKWMLIDDGWSQVSGLNGKLRGFQADTNKFPEGLHHTVAVLKNEYGIEQVGVWHTLNGYWAGIDEASDLGIRYREILFSYIDKVTWTEDSPSVFFLPSPKHRKGLHFYVDWYRFLKFEGIDFVKVDNQLISEKVAQGKLPAAQVAVDLQSNFQSPAKDFFEGKVMNCMSLSNEALQHLPNGATFRSSEDYFPDNQQFSLQAGNEAVHVYNNLMNAVWLHPLGICDFDMFQSHRASGYYHALARALHNGPIYLTDQIGRHDTFVASALCLKNGSLLQADTPLLPLNECLFQGLEEQMMLTKSNYRETILLGAWNTTPQFKSKELSLTSVLPKMVPVALLYDWNKKSLQTVNREHKLVIDLASLFCQHYLIFPASDFVAIGLVDKFVSPAAIVATIVHSNFVDILLKEKGNFAAYSTKPIHSVRSYSGDELAFSCEGALNLIQAKETRFQVFFT